MCEGEKVDDDVEQPPRHLKLVFCLEKYYVQKELSSE